MIEPKTVRVLDELRTSPAWRDAERRVLERESAHRRALVAELATLAADREKEWRALAEASAEAQRRAEAAHLAAEEADRALADRHHAESCASTRYDSQRLRIVSELERTAGERVKAARATITRAMDEARTFLWAASAVPSASTGYRPVGATNHEEIAGALSELRSLLDRPLALAADVADLAELDKALAALELRACEIVAGLPKRPAEGWIARSVQRLSAYLYPSQRPA